MDGNGRWARARGLDRSAGHKAGAEATRGIVKESARLGIEALSLYSFSIENWSRPKDEVEALMRLYAEYLDRERATAMEYNLRVRHIGRRKGLPKHVLDELDESVRATAGNTGMYLCLAVNYSSRAEITDAVRRLADMVKNGEAEPAKIDESAISDALDTAGVPDPDLLVRTSGEMRVSNFLLWQISYAELVVSDVYWPDFVEGELHNVLREYAERHRRFGGVDESNI
jgi:undecaprenyl diphosphate synthase